MRTRPLARAQRWLARTLRSKRRSARARTSIALLATFAPLAAAPAWGQQPWPGETREEAINLTAIEGPGTNDFFLDLSGAFWNSSTRTLWLARNGPVATTSKLWAVVEDGAGGFEVAESGGLRAEWTGFGDLEGVTQAELEEATVYLIIEGEERIKEYDVSSFGSAVLNNTWDTSPHLPRSGGLGAEGITFVPDASLSSAGFLDRFGNPYTSQHGMGGLMLVGHQNGGSIFVFDLDRSTGSFTYVGEYLTPRSEVAGLEFDRSTGQLYVWHDASHDILSVLDLSSDPVVAGVTRRFLELESFDGPNHANNEGIALAPTGDCVNGVRNFFMTTDDGGADSLRWYREFSHGCPLSSLPTLGFLERSIALAFLCALGTWLLHRRRPLPARGRHRGSVRSADRSRTSSGSS